MSDWEIEVSGTQFEFPLCCACCGGTSDTELTISVNAAAGDRKKFKREDWDVPYCRRCVRHVNLNAEASGWQTCLVLLVIVACIAGYFRRQDLLLIGGGATVVGLGLAAAFIAKSKKARRYHMKSCSNMEPAVSCTFWDGNHHTFQITHAQYSQDFLVNNERKLINLRQQVLNHLKAADPTRSIATVRKQGRRYT